MTPLFSPSGLIYRYVLDSPDRSPEELKVIQDWVLYRRYKSIPGIADDSGLGGTTRQYQVVLDPNALNTYHVGVADVVGALSNNNQNAGGGFYQQGGQFYYVRGLGRLTGLADIGNVVVATHERRADPRAQPRQGRASATRRGSASSATWTTTTRSRACCSSAPATRPRPCSSGSSR